MRSSRWLLAVSSIIVLGALTAAPTQANTRESHLITFDFTGTNTEICGPELPLTQTEVGTFTATDFFDNDGNIVSTLVTAHGQLTLTFTNPENGKSTTTHNESQVIKLDYNPDGSRATRTSTGLVFAFTLPGEGRILLETGRFVVDFNQGEIVFVAGPRQFLGGDVEEFCAALG